MFHTLQPHRPQLHAQIHPANPLLHQQQIRHNQTSPQSQNQAASAPKSQIEAMPPSFQPPFAYSPPFSPPFLSQPFVPQPQRSPVYDPATCHPVFFTQTLRKPPFPLADTGGGMAMNPVALGYVVESLGRKDAGPAKL